MSVERAPARNRVAAASVPPTRPRTSRLVVLGVVLASLGVVLTGLSGLLSASTLGQRGFGSFSTPLERYTVRTHALTMEHLDIVTGPGSPEPAAGIGQLTVRATSAVPDHDIFLGVAPQEDVSAYLADVSHSELEGVAFHPFRPRYRDSAGSATPRPATAQDFWTSSAHGPGTQEVTVDLRQRAWAVVVMNADGRPLVVADLETEVTLPWFAPAPPAALLAGLLLQAAGAGLIVVAATAAGRRSRR